MRVNREAAARYGITVGAIQDVIEMAGRTTLALTIEGRQRFVRVRYAPQYRSSPEALASVPVPAPNGMQLPLGQLVDIKQVSGPSMISSENGLPRRHRAPNVRGRDVGSSVEEAKTLVAKTVKLPQGSYIEWSGQYENEVRARQRLQIVIPVVLAVIYILLYLTTRYWRRRTCCWPCPSRSLEASTCSTPWGTTSPWPSWSGLSPCLAPLCRPPW